MTEQTPEPEQFASLLKDRAPKLLVCANDNNIEAAVQILIELQHARAPQLSSESDVMENLREKALLLHDNICNGQFDSALVNLQEMQNVRDKGLYQEIGRLTRALHNAITNFSIDSQPTDEVSELTEASDRLGYVTELTERAANRTLDLVEDSLPLVRAIQSEASVLKLEWQRMVQRDMTPAEFRTLYWRLDEYFQKLDADSAVLSGNMTQIVLAQEFQDLTGQVINRVTGLVKEVESSLVELVLMASKVEAITGIISHGHDAQRDSARDDTQGHGPVIKADQADVVANQDDVDDLLSSLGF
jgi:chemotaxis protein CheZ